MAQFYSAKRRVTTRQIITVTVNDLDPFGQGVARHQGKALFVGGVLPQEQAEVVLVDNGTLMELRHTAGLRWCWWKTKSSTPAPR